jgi:hypothetical protein
VPFMLNEVQPAVRPGDIVVLSLEYDILSGVGVELVLRQLLELRPANSRYIAARRWKKLADVYGFSILGGIARRALLERSPAESTPPGESSDFTSYRRTLFDLAGSYIGHHGKQSLHPELRRIKILEISKANRQRIADFAARCQRRGAHCFFTCPPHPAALLDPMPPGIEHNLRQLALIPQLKVLDRPEDFAFPADAFFDTCYHLVQGAATERTRRLAAELKPFSLKANP